MADTLKQLIVAHVKSTDLVGGRFWQRGYEPKNVTFPYAIMDFINDVNPVIQGDAQRMGQWKQTVQISVFQETMVRDKDSGKSVNKYNDQLAGQLFRSFLDAEKEFGSGDTLTRITVRLQGINDIPQPDEELIKQTSFTIEVTMPLSAI